MLLCIKILAKGMDWAAFNCVLEVVIDVYCCIMS